MPAAYEAADLPPNLPRIKIPSASYPANGTCLPICVKELAINSHHTPQIPK